MVSKRTLSALLAAMPAAALAAGLPTNTSDFEYRNVYSQSTVSPQRIVAVSDGATVWQYIDEAASDHMLVHDVATNTSARLYTMPDFTDINLMAQTADFLLVSYAPNITNGQYDLYRMSKSGDPTPQLLFDPTPGHGCRPLEFTEFGGWVYFTADDGTNGRRLYRTDGTNVENIAIPGAGGPTSVYNLAAGQARLAFVGDRDGARRMYRTNGTTVESIGASLGPTTDWWGGKCLDIDGQRGFGAMSGLMLPPSFTVEAWVNPENTQSGRLLAWSAFAIGGNFNFGEIYFENGKVGLRSQFNDNSAASQSVFGTSTGTVPENEWSHIAVVYDPPTANFRFFINGAYAGQVDYNISPNPTFAGVSLVLGQNGAWKAKVDEFRLWDTARTESQIAAGRFSTTAADPNLLIGTSFDTVNGDSSIGMVAGIIGNDSMWRIVPISPLVVDDATDSIYTSNWRSASGVELWRAPLTGAGSPTLVANVAAGAASSFPSNLVRSPRGGVAFTTTNPPAVHEHSVAGGFDTVATVDDSDPAVRQRGGATGLAATSDGLYFGAPHPSRGRALYYWDAASGTTAPDTLPTGTNNIMRVASAGDDVFFLNSDFGISYSSYAGRRGKYLLGTSRVSSGSPNGMSPVNIGGNIALMGNAEYGTYKFDYFKANAEVDLSAPTLASNGLGALLTEVGAAGDAAGSSVSGVGDVNGDGFEDFAFGAPNADPGGLANAGAVYVALGRGGADLSSLDPAEFVTITGAAAGDKFGTALSGAGDFNGDGYGDILVGAPSATRSGRANQGEAYLIFGAPRFQPGAVLASTDLGGGRGVKFTIATAGAAVGTSVSGLGNMNMDRAATTPYGLDDIIISAPGVNSARGESFIVYGQRNPSSSITLSSLGAAGVRIIGAAADQRWGTSVAGAGDVNGDGFNDVLVSPVVLSTQRPMLLYGGAFGSTYNLGSPIAGTFVRLNLPVSTPVNPLPPNPFNPSLVAPAGDVNGDGFADFLTSDPNYDAGDGPGTGRAYLVYGSSTLLGASGTLTSYSGDQNGDNQVDGWLFDSPFYNEYRPKQIGYRQGFLGDVNGDGFSDFGLGLAVELCCPQTWNAGMHAVMGAQEFVSNVEAAFVDSEGWESGGFGSWTHYALPARPGTDNWNIGQNGVSAYAAARTGTRFLTYQPGLQTFGDARAVTPAIVNALELRFWHRFRTEDPVDGGILEYSTDGTNFINAGGLITQGGYNNTILSTPGWTGHVSSGDVYEEVVVDLSSFQNQTVYIGFRYISDISAAAIPGGWAIDDVTITRRNPSPGSTMMSRILPDNIVRYSPTPHNSAYYPANLPVAAAGDFDRDGSSDFVMGIPDHPLALNGSGVNGGKVALVRGDSSGAEGTYIRWIPTGVDGATLKTLPLAAIGESPDGRFGIPLSRLAMAFQGGGSSLNEALPSRQQVTLRRTAAPAPFPSWNPAPVQWIVQTDRESQSALPVKSTLVFHYTDAEVAGLDPDRIGVYRTLDDPPTADSTWVPIASVRDEVRRTFTMTREHAQGTLGQDVNGTYSIIEVNDVYDLGDEIIPPQVVIDAINAGQLNVFPPAVTPAASGYWHTQTKKLYAASPSSPVQIVWKNDSNTVIATQIVNTRWPDEAELQLHVSGTPEVDLSNGGQFQTIQLLSTDPDNPAGVNKNKLETQKLFEANGSSGDRRGEGRSFLLLSTGTNPAQAPIFFLPVRTVAWDNPNYGDDKNIEIAHEIAEPALHDAAGGGPFVFFERSYYNAKPNYYNRAARTGPIIPVNLDLDATNPEDNMVVVFYEKAVKIKKALEQTLVTNANAFFPYTTVRYTAELDPAASQIVIASLAGSGALDSLGTEPAVYVQNDRALPGFNPNEEHALISGGVMYALRDDLNVVNSTSASNPDTSRPYSLVQFQRGDGTFGMHYFHVVAQDATHAFSYPGVAGTPVDRPPPISLLAFVEPCPDTSTTSTPNGSKLVSGEGYVDKNGKLWARNGSPLADFTKDKEPGWLTDTVNNPPVPLVYQYFYPNQPGFYWPAEPTGAKPNGTCVPWLDVRAGTPGVPISVTYNIVWPANNPELRAGQTLLTAAVGLPDITNQLSVKVVYDQSAGGDPTAGNNNTPLAASSVALSDPLTEIRVPLSSLPTDIKQEARPPKVVFPDLEPSLKARLYYDTGTQDLVFRGFYVTEDTPQDYILPNAMTTREKNVLKAFSSNSSWDDAIDDFPGPGATGTSFLKMIAPPPPAAVKALSSTGKGQGFVTLVFGDNIGTGTGQQTPSNALISMNVIKVTCPPFRGAVDPIEPDCVFDEKITMRHTADLSAFNDSYEYQWAFQPDSSGTQPPLPGELGDVNPDDDLNWQLIPSNQLVPDTGLGAVDFTIKGSSLLTLSDNWIIVRYRKASNPLCGTGWSDWTPPALAEGWIKRVLGRIDPFRQRAVGGGLQTAEDRFFQYNNTTVNTMVSMIAQSGRRYSGDVALNCSVLDSFGLIEIYQTVLNRGAKLSINGIPPVDYPPANNALLLAASRISDLYMLLGNEAYADASDPTIGIGSDDSVFGAVASSIHAFMNQVPTLIHEELALLRGRDDQLAPGTQVAPVFNRLFWNFTRDITGGEVAYALNYNIKDASGNVDGAINAIDAEILYPQGHGDAWGHYLTAMKTYIRLLREPNYTWIPRAEAVNVNGVPVSVDYMDERRFAAAASAKARAGAEIVSLTYRAAFTENPQGQFTGYADSDPDRAWGLSEWASRAGQGAYFDYVLANAILPPVDDTGEGIQKIDRRTVPELNEIAGRMLEIQAKVDSADSGLNPLGLSKEIMLFDIDPTQVVSTFGIAEPHFERVYNKALLALSNASTAFDYANAATQALRSQADSIADFQNTVSDQEFDFRNRLIEIFGYPYPDDIGPGGTYPAGYEGPDLIHWMIADPLAVIGVTAPDSNPITITYVDDFVLDENGNFDFNDDGTPNLRTRSVTFSLATNGAGFVKPRAWTSKRRAPGEIQIANSDLIQAKYALEQGTEEYATLVRAIQLKADELSRRTQLKLDQIGVLGGILAQKIAINALIVTLKSFELGARTLSEFTGDAGKSAGDTVPTTVIAGLAGGGNFLQPIAGALKLTGVVGKASLMGAGDGFEVGGMVAELSKEIIEAGIDIRVEQLNSDFEIGNIKAELELLLREEPAKRLEHFQLQEAVMQSAAALNQAIASGYRVLEERIRFRITTAASVQEYRYKDMAFRIFRNDALQKYRATFDLAAQYAYLAAKSYDYETNFLPGDPAVPGSVYMTNITRSRSLGTIVDGEPQPGGASGDPGLAAQLARMKTNWELNLKPRLGFTNPQLEVNVFSLRRELFRIPDGDEGAEQWQGVLQQAYRANILNDPDFRRSAIPFTPALAEEPGFVFKFDTTINFGKNYFGWDLGAGDSAYDSTATSTKMRRNAILFEGYNDTTELSATPRLYFFPAGTDVMRSPTGGRREIRTWRLFEQLIPVPFPLSEGDLGSSPDLIPRFDSLTGELTQRRKFGLDRAFDSLDLDLADPGSPSLVGFTTRLVGRSAWNSKWVMIIPAGSMLADREEAVRQFIYGADGSGGISDILLSFETYAFQAFSRGGETPPEHGPEDPPSVFDFAPVLGRSPISPKGGN